MTLDRLAMHSFGVAVDFPDIREQFDAMFPRMVPEKSGVTAATGYLSGTSLMGFVEGDIATCGYNILYRYDFTPV